MNNSDNISIISASIALISVLFSFIVFQRTKRIEKWSMRDEYDDLISKRSIFWENLRVAFDKFQKENKSNVLPKNLMSFIDSAGIPNNILKCKNIKLFELKEASDNQKQMELFCNLIYPIDTNNINQLKEKSIINSENSLAFCEARSVLSGFWDRWSNRKRRKWIIMNFTKEKYMILMLTWLDVSHRKWTKEDDIGKQKMYTIAKDFID